MYDLRVEHSFSNTIAHTSTSRYDDDEFRRGDYYTFSGMTVVAYQLKPEYTEEEIVLRWAEKDRGKKRRADTAATLSDEPEHMPNYAV